jgi:hypothetical protein
MALVRGGAAVMVTLTISAVWPSRLNPKKMPSELMAAPSGSAFASRLR